MMKQFFERNKPIFKMGIILLVVFLGIIFYYMIKPHKETQLSKGEGGVNYSVYEDNSNSYDAYDLGDEQFSQDEQVWNQEQGEQKEPENLSIDEKYGIVEVEYNQNGFSPKTARIVQGQVVNWTNKTDRVMYFRQKTPVYGDLSQVIEITPGDSLSFRFTEPGRWTCEEDVTKNFHSITIYAPEEYDEIMNFGGSEDSRKVFPNIR